MEEIEDGDDPAMASNLKQPTDTKSTIYNDTDQDNKSLNCCWPSSQQRGSPPFVIRRTIFSSFWSKFDSSYIDMHSPILHIDLDENHHAAGTLGKEEMSKKNNVDADADEIHTHNTTLTTPQSDDSNSGTDHHYGEEEEDATTCSMNPFCSLRLPWFQKPNNQHMHDKEKNTFLNSNPQTLGHSSNTTRAAATPTKPTTIATKSTIRKERFGLGKHSRTKKEKQEEGELKSILQHHHHHYHSHRQPPMSSSPSRPRVRHLQETQEHLKYPSHTRSLPQSQEIEAWNKSNPNEHNTPHHNEQHHDSHHHLRFNPIVSVKLYKSEDVENQDYDENKGLPLFNQWGREGEGSRRAVVGVGVGCSVAPPQKQCSTWYTSYELNSFRMESLTLIRQHRSLSVNQTYFNRRPLYANPALKITKGDVFVAEDSYELKMLLTTHIRHILIVEPHQILIDLYIRSIQEILPHVTFFTAKNCSDALNQIQINSNSINIAGDKDRRKTFDIIIAEERIGHGDHGMGCEEKKNEHHDYEILSGSELFHKISTNMMNPNTATIKNNSLHTDTSNNQNVNTRGQGDDVERLIFDVETLIPNDSRVPLLIGTSAYLGEDCQKLRQGGADMFWGKPPPTMDASLRNDLLTEILRKRGQNNVILG